MKEYNDISRRAVVRTLGIGGTAAIEGCMGGSGTENQETTTARSNDFIS